MGADVPAKASLQTPQVWRLYRPLRGQVRSYRQIPPGRLGQLQVRPFARPTPGVFFDSSHLPSDG
ncbi:hypothetical protein EGJ27_16360 [Pseudomonas sp. v388]|nr:hypothetical protein EGJ27_16360 [Pseudomonas sp. v388]